MTGCVGLLILIGIVALIAVLGMKGKTDSGKTNQFYQKYSLIPITVVPAKIFEAIGVEKLYCRQGNLKSAGAAAIPFYWCEWSNQSMIISGNSRQIVNDYYFAAAFAPEIVSDEFIQESIEFADKSGDDFSQKAKDLFVLNTEKPYRVEKLTDGSLLICWRAKNLAEDYERAFSWLENNVSPYSKNEILPEMPHEQTKESDVKNETKTEIRRLPIEEFLEEMSAENYNRSRDIINITDSIIWNYHETKGHENMSAEDHAGFLQMNLEDVKTALAKIREIEFPVDEFLAKGFQIPELLKYEYQLAYQLDFPSRMLIYLDRAQIFLDDSEPLKVYIR